MQKLHKSSAICALSLALGYVLLSLPLVSVIWAGAERQAPSAKESVYITMEALHAAGGVPPGWQFHLPAGDAQAGREVFVIMQCYTCHTVKGETFPAYPPREVGPDLTGMGAHHPAAYFAESIINPNAVIVTGESYTGPDSRSRMPEYFEMTIAQLINLVAYLKSLREPMPPTHHSATSHTHRPAEGHMHGSDGHGSHPHTK